MKLSIAHAGANVLHISYDALILPGEKKEQVQVQVQVQSLFKASKNWKFNK